MTLDIPNYRILEKLGVGAQTRIFRARCMRTGKDYAVKIVKVQSPEDTSVVELMRAEHQIGSAIDHANVRKVYELRLIRQRLRIRGAILFMEYVDGVPITANGPGQTLDNLLAQIHQVAQALEAMHVAGYVHADLKPGNMLVTPDGRVKLIDFGQSAEINQAKQRVQGTPDYMAPEQAQRRKLDERTDVFGLGATLHRLLTGQPIVTEINQTVNLASPILMRRDNGELASKMISQLPTPLVRLIGDCCKSDPAERPKDMGAMMKRIDLVRTIIARPAEAAAAYDEDHDGAPDDYYDDHDAEHYLGDAVASADRTDDFDEWDDLIGTSDPDV